MLVEIKIPSPGESITEVEIAQWLVNDGDYVQKDQELGEIESDKATLPIMAEKAGKIKILLDAGTTIQVGTVACSIDTDAIAPVGAKDPKPDSGSMAQKTIHKHEYDPIEDKKEEAPLNAEELPDKKIKSTPLAKKMMEENHLNVDDIVNGLRKITSREVNQVITLKSEVPTDTVSNERTRKSEKMSSLRRKISQRLVAVKNETAMLTTFNEVDMTAIMELRKKYQKVFVEKHGLKLGFMSFFTKAVTAALLDFPKINSFIEGENIVTPQFTDIGIAVQTDKGLMVPVVRNTQMLSIAQIEIQIAELAKKARAFRITPEEMSGGTFTITNGGVFGSMLSTPILNPPQSGILGMHNIIERPIAVNGEVVVRPMMYIALSYDHRIVDGRDSVSFLVKVKEYLEAPIKLLFTQQDSDHVLLGI
jgi:2-oxoglutarate dehydrogenase E2 component (dihydrolipoamide succinyltransferase)